MWPSKYPDLLLLLFLEAAMEPFTGDGIGDGLNGSPGVPGDLGRKWVGGGFRPSGKARVELEVPSAIDFARSSLYLPLRLFERPDASELDRSLDDRVDGSAGRFSSWLDRSWLPPFRCPFCTALGDGSVSWLGERCRIRILGGALSLIGPLCPWSVKFAFAQSCSAPSSAIRC